MIILKHKTKDKTIKLQEVRYNYLIALGTDFSQYDEVKHETKRKKELEKIFEIKSDIESDITSEQTNEVLINKKKKKEDDL
jgi:hypothetical protein